MQKDSFLSLFLWSPMVHYRTACVKSRDHFSMVGSVTNVWDMKVLGTRGFPRPRHCVHSTQNKCIVSLGRTYSSSFLFLPSSVCYRSIEIFFSLRAYTLKVPFHHFVRRHENNIYASLHLFLYRIKLTFSLWSYQLWE